MLYIDSNLFPVKGDWTGWRVVFAVIHFGWKRKGSEGRSKLMRSETRRKKKEEERNKIWGRRRDLLFVVNLFKEEREMEGKLSEWVKQEEIGKGRDAGERENWKGSSKERRSGRERKWSKTFLNMHWLFPRRQTVSWGGKGWWKWRHSPFFVCSDCKLLFLSLFVSSNSFPQSASLLHQHTLSWQILLFPYIWLSV